MSLQLIIDGWSRSAAASSCAYWTVRLEKSFGSKGKQYFKHKDLETHNHGKVFNKQKMHTKNTDSFQSNISLMICYCTNLKNWILPSGTVLCTGEFATAAEYVLQKLGCFVAGLDWLGPSCGSTSNPSLTDGRCC